VLTVAILLLATHPSTAARSIDRNGALIGWSEELATQRIVLSTQYGKVQQQR
jgi:hypothetical protein